MDFNMDKSLHRSFVRSYRREPSSANMSAFKRMHDQVPKRKRYEDDHHAAEGLGLSSVAAQKQLHESDAALLQNEALTLETSNRVIEERRKKRLAVLGRLVISNADNAEQSKMDQSGKCISKSTIIASMVLISL